MRSSSTRRSRGGQSPPAMRSTSSPATSIRTDQIEFTRPIVAPQRSFSLQRFTSRLSASALQRLRASPSFGKEPKTVGQYAPSQTSKPQRCRRQHKAQVGLFEMKVCVDRTGGTMVPAQHSSTMTPPPHFPSGTSYPYCESLGLIRYALHN